MTYTQEEQKQIKSVYEAKNEGILIGIKHQSTSPETKKCLTSIEKKLMNLKEENYKQNERFICLEKDVDFIKGTVERIEKGLEEGFAKKWVEKIIWIMMIAVIGEFLVRVLNLI